MVFSPDDCTDCDVFALNALEKGCSVYDQGDTALQFYYVKEGLVGLYHIWKTENQVWSVYIKKVIFSVSELFSAIKIIIAAQL